MNENPAAPADPERNSLVALMVVLVATNVWFFTQLISYTT
jgi:hypothetical protein